MRAQPPQTTGSRLHPIRSETWLRRYPIPSHHPGTQQEPIAESTHNTADVAMAVAAAVEQQAAATAEITCRAAETAYAAQHVTESIEGVSRNALEAAQLTASMRRAAVTTSGRVQDFEKAVVQVVRTSVWIPCQRLDAPACASRLHRWLLLGSGVMGCL